MILSAEDRDQYMIGTQPIGVNADDVYDWQSEEGKQKRSVA
jgi:hypothetical protein